MRKVDRDWLSIRYVDTCIKGMTVEAMLEMIREFMHERLDELTDAEFKQEVQDTYPDMLKDIE